MCHKFNKSILIKFLLFSISMPIIYSCNKQKNNNNETFLSTNHTSHFDNNLADVFNETFINEFKSTIEQNITLTNSLTNEINVLGKINENSTKQEKYIALFNLLKKLPYPWIDSPYKTKHNSLVENLKYYYEENSSSVPKLMHFVWIGGPMGDAQMDYIKIWAQMNPDYKVNIWYDSSNLFTYETQKSLKEYLSLSLFQHKNDSKYEKIFAEQLNTLQNKLYSYFETEKNKNNSLTKDEIRVKFIDHELYKKPNDKIAAKKFNDNVTKIEKDKENLVKEYKNIQFININEEINNWQLKSSYEQELSLRSNFAAASDSARLEILKKYGGIYIDVDLLPTMKPIYEFIESYPVYKNSFAMPLGALKMAFLEEVLNNNPNLIPSRKEYSNKYMNALKRRINFIISSDNIEEDFKQIVNKMDKKITEIAKKTKNATLEEIFFAIGEFKVKDGEFKIVKGNNAFIASQPVTKSSDWIQQLIDNIKENYLEINSLPANNPDMKLPYKKLEKISEGIAKNFRYDGLILGQDSTISVSGPSVFTKLLEKNPSLEYLTSIENYNKIFNPFTPENVVSSWFKRTSSLYMQPKNAVIQLSDEENISSAANNIFNKYKDISDIYSIKEDKLVKQNIPSPLDDEETIIPDIDYSKVNLHIVGHAEIDKNGKIFIADLNPNDLATKIKQALFNSEFKPQLEYISIVSCNPTGDPNNTNQIENYSEQLLDKLNELEIPVRVASVRTTFVKIAKNGEKLYLHNNNYTGHQEGDKLFVFRKGKEEFFTVKAQYNLEQLNNENITETKNFFSNLSLSEMELFEKEAAGPLGEVPKIIKSIQNSYDIFSHTNILAENIKKVTNELRTEYNLNNDYSPFFPSLDRAEQKINFINTNTGEFKKNIPLTQEAFNYFSDTWTKLNLEMRNIKSMPIATNQEGLLRTYSNSPEGLGITPLLVAQTLFSAFKTIDAEKNIDADHSLSKIIQIQSYVFYSQLGTDVFNKINQIENIVSTLIHTNVFADEANLFPKINYVLDKLKAARYVGVGLGLANVTLDAFEYSYAQGSQKPIFATQLSFDLLNISMTLASFALGESAASSVLGYLSTPLAGLSIGFTGFASAAVDSQDKSIQIAKFFNEYQQDHSRVGNLSDCSPENNAFSFAHSKYFKNEDGSCTGNLNSAVIKEIDLTSDETVKLQFGSHNVYKTSNWNRGIFWSYYSNFQGSSNFPEASKTNLFNLRESLNIPTTQSYPISGDSIIILPFLVEKNISYNYSYTPGIMTRHDAELNAINKISSNKSSEFVFRYFVDLFEYAIRNLSFQTNNTEIKIKLGKKSRTLITPTIPIEYANKVNYNIQGGQGKYIIAIANNANYNIILTKDDELTIDANSLKREMQFIGKGKFKFSENLNINLSGNLPNEITIKEEKRIYKIDTTTGALTDLIEVNASNNSNNNLLSNLKEISGKIHKHDGFIKINNYIANTIYKTAWYDIKGEEIIHPYMEKDEYYDYSQLQFLGKEDHIVYYFDPKNKIIFEQNLLIHDKPNTKPLAISESNSNPFFDHENGSIIYKTKNERTMSGRAKDWIYTLSRDSTGRYLVQVELSELENIDIDSIEMILKNQKAFHIKQPIKVIDSSSGLIAWFLKSDMNLPTDKFIVATSKDNNKTLKKPEFAGYIKKNNGTYIYFFRERDEITKRNSFYKQEGERGKAEKILIPPFNNQEQQIISFSIYKNHPFILTDNRFFYHFNEDGEIVLAGFNFVTEKDTATDLNSIIKNILTTHKNYLNTLSIFDANGGFAWYDVYSENILLFHSDKKYIGKDNKNRHYFMDINSKKIYFKALEKGNAKNYSLKKVNNKISLHFDNLSESLELATNFSTEILITNKSIEDVPSILEIEDKLNKLKELEPRYKEREQVESNKAKALLEGILKRSLFKAEQAKLDNNIPKGGTPRRSIIFVNEGWYNSALEIEIQNENGTTALFHSWWGAKGGFTRSPLIPIDTTDIKISVQSNFFGWSHPFYEEHFTVSDLPLCLTTSGTLFSRSVITHNCNTKQ